MQIQYPYLSGNRAQCVHDVHSLTPACSLIICSFSIGIILLSMSYSYSMYVYLFIVIRDRIILLRLSLFHRNFVLSEAGIQHCK